jgi:hypothetical protein
MGLFFRAGLAAALLGAGALLAPLGAYAQECTARAITSSTAEVYQSPPRYATGVGWQGVQIERLSSGVALFVCRELNLDFGFSTRTWVQIGYRSAGGDWRFGWISKETVRMAVRTDGAVKRLYAGPTESRPMLGGGRESCADRLAKSCLA